MSKKITKKATKKVVAKKKATKPAKKKAVAKKKPTMADKVRNQYKIVSNWSDSLMQDVYSVVYRTNTLKTTTILYELRV